MLRPSYAVLVIVGVMGGCRSRDSMPKQEVDVKISSDSPCETCVLAIDSIATLSGALLGSFSTSIATDPAGGTFYLVDPADQVIRVYGRDGVAVRSLGRKGGAPGEFEMIRNLVPMPDGSLQVLDPLLSRRTVFGSDGAFLSSARIGLPPALDHPVALRPDGQLFANAAKQASADSMTALQLIAADGEVVASFDTIKADPSRQWRAKRLLWQRADGSVLVAGAFAPRITVYGPDLHPGQSIHFPAGSPIQAEPTETPSDGVFDKPLTARLLAMWQDPEGLLWLVTLAPSPAWEPRPPVPGMTGPEYRKYGDRPRVVTVVEALDLKRAKLVFRSQVDGPIGLVFGQGLVARQTDNAVGEPMVRISQITLKR